MFPKVSVLYLPTRYFGLASGAGVSASSPASSTSTAEPGTISKLTGSLPVGWKVLFHIVNVPLVSARIMKNLMRRRTTAAEAIWEGVLDGYRGREGKWRRHDERLLKRNAT